MRLPAVPVHSFEDATLDMEALQKTLTTPGAALPFVQLLTAQKLRLAIGAGNVTFTASTDSALTTVTHNIGAAVQFCGAFNTTGAALWFSTNNVTATTMGVLGSFRSAISGTFSFVWIALG